MADRRSPGRSAKMILNFSERTVVSRSVMAPRKPWPRGGCNTVPRGGMDRLPVGSVTRVIGRIPILDVQPAVDCGSRPAKAVTGETFEVSATVFREGHGVIGVGVVLRDPVRNTWPAKAMRLLAPGTDRYGT